MIVRKMEISDMSTVLEIEQACFQAPYDEKQYVYELEDNPCAHLYVLEEQKQIVGYIDYWITFESCQLCKVAVRDDMQRKGYGEALMNHMFQDALERDCEAILLEVRVSNEKAIRFYKKFDFLEISIRKKYYVNPQEDGFLMGKVLVGE